MQYRKYGNKSDELSIVGFGGIVVCGKTQNEADRVVAEAVDMGVNYFDVAPAYMEAEERFGPALKPFRDKVFLACKTGQRDAIEGKAELERSLKRLQTDHFDLYQLHAIGSVDDVKAAFGPGGVMEMIVRAKDQGIIRNIGFSAHSEEAAEAALERFPFDSALFPLNYITAELGGFGKKIAEAAEKYGAARLALKAMAKRPWPEGAERAYPFCWYEPFDDIENARYALRWTLSQEITAAIPPGDEKLFKMAVEIANDFTPLSQDELAEAKTRAAEFGPIFNKQAA